MCAIHSLGKFQKDSFDILGIIWLRQRVNITCQREESVDFVSRIWLRNVSIPDPEASQPNEIQAFQLPSPF
jgi:hypothetical protein